jgi:rhamnogalacturonan endolyase
MGLMIDYASNHRGAATMNITTGFDRIFGPSYIYLNRDGDVQTLLSDAEQYAYVGAFRVMSALKCRNSTFASDFYDEIAEFIPGYVPSSGRGDFSARITLPDGAGMTKAVLSMNGADMQDNVDYGMSASFSLPSARVVGSQVTKC